MLLNTLENIRNCTACSLRSGAKQVVLGIGSISAEILILGEAPGVTEDETGIPFSGKSGIILTQTMAEVGLDINNVFISNIVKCRPPQNRKPRKNEITACSGNTEDLINTINPKLIVAVGKSAIEYFIPVDEQASNYFGNVIVSKTRINNTTYKHRHVYCIIHPAAGLHNPDPILIENIKKYIRRIPVALEKVKNQQAEKSSLF